MIRHFQSKCRLVDYVGGKGFSNANITASINSQISSEQLLILLQNYGKLYSKMSDLKKKEFYHAMIERIESNPEPTADGRYVKRIDFNFPVSYNSENNTIGLINGNDVETVVFRKYNCCAVAIIQPIGHVHHIPVDSRIVLERIVARLLSSSREPPRLI